MKRLLPAYPLFVKDPYFSIWSQSDILNEKDVIFWMGKERRVRGYVRIDGKLFCFLGKDDNVSSAVQESVSITSFTTDYVFSAGKAKIKLQFVSPLPPDNLDLLSCPVCYLNYEVTGVKDCEVILTVGQSVCYDTDEYREVRGGAVSANGYELSCFGLKRQLFLSEDNDSCSAEWGYWYLSGEESYFVDDTDLKAYLKNGVMPEYEDKNEEKWLVSVSKALSGKVMLGFDDVMSINYFGDVRKGYYLENHTIFEAFDYINNESSEIDKQLACFDADLRKKAALYGEDYLNILYASLRQAVGAHKLIRNKEGEVIFLSKECCSNGCIGTVDVSYPSIPLFLLYNPELVLGMVRPIFKFAKLPVWKFDFAPHDVGTYPNCCGQVYGAKVNGGRYLATLEHHSEKQTRFPLYCLPEQADAYGFKNQMPVEECANMLVMLASVGDFGKKIIAENFELLEKWTAYLVNYGLKPENQLCTDDFSGHLKNNLNLAIKAVVGIGCFAEFCKDAGLKDKYTKYRKVAEDYAAEIEKFAFQFGHSPLTWDLGEETFSLKYNLAFDRILKLNLFSKKFKEREVDYYLSISNEFGVPLDSRATFTKSDWLVWTASLTEDINKRKQLIAPLNNYLLKGEKRLPFGDWYYTETGKLKMFTNRTVQGGCFILLI